jgi:hypothetical protein
LVWGLGEAEVQELKANNKWPTDEAMIKVVDFMIRNRQLTIEEAKFKIRHNRGILKKLEEAAES